MIYRGVKIAGGEHEKLIRGEWLEKFAEQTFDVCREMRENLHLCFEWHRNNDKLFSASWQTANIEPFTPTTPKSISNRHWMIRTSQIINHLQFIFDYLSKLLTYITAEQSEATTQIELIYFIISLPLSRSRPLASPPQPSAINDDLMIRVSGGALFMLNFLRPHIEWTVLWIRDQTEYREESNINI